MRDHKRPLPLTIEDHLSPSPGQKLTRRQVLKSALAVVGASMLMPFTPAFALSQESGTTPPDPTRIVGSVPSEIGSRSPFEHPHRHVFKPLPSSWSMTPLEDLYGIITPSDLHFERHHGGIAEVDPHRYKLLIHGMVEREMVFTLNDLKRFPAQSRICFIECSGNGSAGYYTDTMPTHITPGELDGLTSTSEWTGVPLELLFREVGIQPGASWFLAEGGDAAVMTRSIPLEKAYEDAMIVYAQNGEALRPAQGYPARLLLPGWEGNTQIKWIRRIEVADRPFMTREETAKYTDPLGNGTARMFSFVMDAKSIITFPAYPAVLPDKGWWEIRGIAWSGRGKIVRVDISTDGGKQWFPAELQQPVLPKCHTRFRAVWKWNGKQAYLMSRAMDETGYVQPTLQQLIAARGPATYYHTNNIRAWKVKQTGEAVFGLGDLI